jgi:hypothetical protein
LFGVFLLLGSFVPAYDARRLSPRLVKVNEILNGIPKKCEMDLMFL